MKDPHEARAVLEALATQGLQAELVRSTPGGVEVLFDPQTPASKRAEFLAGLQKLCSQVAINEVHTA